MSASVLDSRVFRNLFGTQEMRDVFSDASYVWYMIEVEAAVAVAQSKIGIIPPHVGEALAKELGEIEIK